MSYDHRLCPAHQQSAKGKRRQVPSNSTTARLQGQLNSSTARMGMMCTRSQVHRDSATRTKAQSQQASSSSNADQPSRLEREEPETSQVCDTPPAKRQRVQTKGMCTRSQHGRDSATSPNGQTQHPQQAASSSNADQQQSSGRDKPDGPHVSDAPTSNTTEDGSQVLLPSVWYNTCTHTRRACPGS
jgi:hypothetical protein